MESVRDLKKRIRSVKNISQITKAMEAVSATKMRRSQQFAIGARPYAVAAFEMLENLLSRTPELPPLLLERPIKRSLLLVISSDKGLAGAFNSAILKKSEQWIERKKGAGADFSVMAVGKKARDKLKHRHVPMEQNFIGFGDYTELKDTLPIADLVLHGFLGGKWDEVIAVYTNFKSTLKQEAVIKKILPVTREGIEEMVASILPERGRYSTEKTTNYKLQTTNYRYEYKFEPSPAEILNVLVPQLLRVHIHHIILESNASEHSARMVAMKNASENAKELIGELSLAYNKSRQAGITRELTEITAGREALEV
ncbi:MAG: ATP synthase F1 subunit gamma [Candidatus Sungbacteria bacterium]|nr:ATP synthase F1 subunit gamma [Candidatus Sungbacteria bacterium]